eukprot:gene7906-16188_t
MQIPRSNLNRNYRLRVIAKSVVETVQWRGYIVCFLCKTLRLLHETEKKPRRVYVSLAEGPESARLNTLLPSKTLYSQGAKYLLHNDKEMNLNINRDVDRVVGDGVDDPQTQTQGVEDLTYRQASEAIREGMPLYLHVWFDSPHGPWEIIDPFHKQYGDSFGNEQSIKLKYASMVSSLDYNVG